MNFLRVGFLSFAFFFSTSLWACAVCGFGQNDGARIAFLVTTALMTLLPLIMAGIIIYSLYRITKKKQTNRP